MVVQTARAPVHLPWEYRERVELIDGPPPVAAAEPIVADLRTLGYDQRVAVVLECYTGLRAPQIADILARSVSGAAPAWPARHEAVLAINQPERTNDETLLAELQDAIPYELRESHGSADDLSHGRRSQLPSLAATRIRSPRRGGLGHRRGHPAHTHSPTDSPGGTLGADLHTIESELRSSYHATSADRRSC